MRIVFSKSDSFLSKLIRYFDKGKWSHVAIMMDDNHVIDARFPRGVQVRHVDFKSYEMLEVDGDLNKALNFIGYKYDLLHFFWYGIKYGDKPWNNPNELLCSELISEAIGDDNLKGKTPNEQYRYLLNRVE